MEDRSKSDGKSKAALPMIPKFSSFRPPPSVASSSSKGVEPKIKEEKRSRRDKVRSRSNSPESRKKKHHKKSSQIKVERDLILEVAEDLGQRKRNKASSNSSNHTLALSVDTKVKKEKHIEFPEYLTTEFNLYLDSRGDSGFSHYGSFDQSKIPHYKLSGGGVVIGLSSDWKLNARNAAQRLIQHSRVANPKKKPPRYMEFRKSAPTIFLQKDRNYKQNDLTLECPLIINLKQNVQEDNMEDDYTSKEMPEAQDDGFRSKIRGYESRIKQRPHDIDLWLEYIHFQAREEDLLGRNRHSARSIKNEIKISMFERALESNPDSERLMLEYLKCCQQVWSSAQLLSKWDQVLSQHPKNLSLWLQYISYRLTELSAFSVNSILEIYSQCLQNIGTSGVQAQKDSMKIIDRLCRFLRDSGFSERAIGIYQALIEWNFYCPTELRDHSIRLESFRIFWEKEWPRFGEDGATGWDSFEDLIVTPYYRPHSVNNHLYSDFHKKIQQEQELDLNEHLPVNSSLINDSSQLDPHRVVLFEDVVPFLISFTSDDSKQELISCFIRFAVMPNYGQGSTISSTVDPLLYTDLGLRSSLESFFPKFSAFGACNETLKFVHGMCVASEPPTAQSQVGTFAAPMRYFPHNGEDFFSPSFTINSFNPRIICPVYYRFVCNSMRELSNIALRFSSLDPTLVYLTSSSTMDPTNFAARFSTAVANNSTSLPLHAAYASHYFQDKKYSEARGIFNDCIKRFWDSPVYFKKVHITFIYRVWVDLELRSGTAGMIKVILAAYATKKEVQFEDANFLYFGNITTSDIKATENVFSNNPVTPNFKSSDPKLEPTFDHIHLHAVLQYLTNGIEACCSIYDKALSFYSPSTNCPLSLELLYLRYVSLLQVYIKSGTGFKPTIVRKVLEDALSKFPSNTVFLEAYRQLESQYRFAGRLRNFLTHTLHLTPSLPLWFFAIFSELNLPPGQGSVHFTRSLFEKALECPTTLGCSSLWALFIAFEVQQNELDAATRLLFRAVHACPFSKDLCVLGLSRLILGMPKSHSKRPDSQSKELESQFNELIHVMLENNLRLRVLN